MRRVREKSSRRQSLRQKYMICKKVKAWRKKKNKEAKRLKKLGIRFKKGNKKTMLIPNAWVGKEKLLREEIELRKQEIIEEAQRVSLKKMKRRAAKLLREEMERDSGVNADFTNSQTQTNIRDANREIRKQHYQSELTKLIDECDVVVEVLDARDPLACRSQELEARVTSMNSATVGSSKKLILLLNKIDLIPPEILCKWMQYLRREYPVIAFKAKTEGELTQFGRRHLINPHIHKQAVKCIGDEAFVSLLKSYSNTVKVEKFLTVGFVGYPNVGKSSIINSLNNKELVLSSHMPGFTQNLKRVSLSKRIRLIDSPGVIFNESDDVGGLALKQSVRLQEIDVNEAVNKIVSRLNPIQLMEHYGIPGFKTGNGLIAHLAKQKGLMNGDVPNYKVAARAILKEWKLGKVRFYQPPPEFATPMEESEGQFKQDWGEDLDINGIINVNMENASTEIESTIGKRKYVVLKPPPAEKMDVED